MRKSITRLLLGTALIVMLMSCSTTGLGSFQSKPSRVAATKSLDPASDGKPFHVIRTIQQAPIPKGATVGIVASTPGAFSIFMSSALESKGLTVRETNLYSFLPPAQQQLIDPQGRYTFMDDLANETVNIVKQKGDASLPTAESSTTNLDVDALIEKVSDSDDLLIEKQRANHYLSLLDEMKAVIKSLNVDYLLVSGAPYTGLSYSVKIYDTKNFNVVFSNVVVADPVDWREEIGSPEKSKELSFNFETEGEPSPYWDLSYCEYIAGKIEFQE
ncbi:MAG: hypothetical protein PQJ46_03650 [Spirochaetales bacterium]|nr:hypothetical protein [Spirochaetales bacterium]